MATFEGYERREAKILSVLKEYGINSIDECKTICEEKGIDPYTIVQETQPICFENAKWAYTVGCAIAIKMGCTKAADAAAAIGIGLQAFCIPGSVAENRRSASATAIWAKCSFPRRPSASHSSLATSPSRLLRVPSRLL